MSLLDLRAVARHLPSAWNSSIVAQVGPARIKVVRMDEQAYGEETHPYNEGLLVLDGEMMLEVAGMPVTVGAGEMYLAEAGVPHAVLPGSHGTLVIIDL